MYEWFAATGQAPTVTKLASRLGERGDDIVAGLRRLHDRRHVVLDASDQILMAHPFSAVPLGFAVMGDRTLWWGGCAWDSFAIPHLVVSEPEVLVSTRCPGCGTPHAWVVNGDEPPPGEQVAHFLVPVQHIWDDVVHTCRHQRLCCGERCVDDWLARSGNQRGYVMDVPTLWRLAQHWYDGRLDRGYIRREPEQAREYFREVGLRGPFWGL